MATLLIINGSVRGPTGDVARALAHARAAAPAAGFDDVDELILTTLETTVEDVAARVTAASAIVFGTGTYWGSWGSSLQRFLEVLTPLEATPALLGKPVGAVITMDSVGGVDVGVRLLGVLAMMGAVVPPLPIVVLSRVAAVAIANLPEDPTTNGVDGALGDVWRTEDIAVMVQNLGACLDLAGRFKAWPVHQGRLPPGPWPHAGVLDLGFPHFVVDDKDNQEPPQEG